MAGAVLRASRKGYGAPGRRGPRLLSVWQAQYLEPPERVAARLVAVGRGSCPKGCAAPGRRGPWAAAPVRVAGAVLGASRKGCGAPGRRWARLQYLIKASRKGWWRAWSPWAAAPACVAGAMLRASRKGCGAPGLAGAVLGASRKGCGAPGRHGPRLLSVWQAQLFIILILVMEKLNSKIEIKEKALN